MISKTLYAPILNHCSFRNSNGEFSCKKKPEVMAVKLEGDYLSSSKYVGFACLCKEHRDGDPEKGLPENVFIGTKKKVVKK